MTELLIKLEKIFVSNSLLGLVISYAAGVVASFSPCVYPLIPITLGIVGAAATNSKLKGFSLSFIFVLGMCCTYTFLGVLAALTGMLISSFFIHPITYAVLGLIFIFLSLSVWGIITLPFLSFSPNYKAKQNWLSLFILGIISGLAFIPCNFPVLGGILSLISLKKNVGYGALALFLFSLGFSTLLLIIGTFSALMPRLPKSGSWLIRIKQILGLILLVIGGYFLFKSLGMLL